MTLFLKRWQKKSAKKSVKMSFLTTLKSRHSPIASGYSSDIYLIDGKITKVLEDGCYDDTLKEVVIQQAAADAGLAPQVYSVFEVSGAAVIIMEAIDTNRLKPVVSNTPIGYNPRELGSLSTRDMILGSKLFAQLVSCGIIHADFHVQNWLKYQDKVIALDFGTADFIEDASLRYLQKAVRSITPALAFINEYGLIYSMTESSDRAELRTLLRKASALLLSVSELSTAT